MVDLSTISLMCFVGTASAVGAVTLLVRDLRAPLDLTTGRSNGHGKARRFRRFPSALEDSPARTVTGKIDQAFDRLVLESGFENTPMTAFLMMLACGLFTGGALWSYYARPALALVGGTVGFVVPLMILSIQRIRRLRAIREQLPHVLDMFSRAIRAGQSLEQAIHLVGHEAGGVLGAEFKRCAQQLEMGRSFAGVMKTLARRVRLMEMRILATTLIVHRQAGGNLPETLERMSGVVRDRLSAHRQMRATTGAGRTSAVIIGTICPLAYLVMFIWQPEHMSRLLADALGQSLLITAVVLELVGALWVAAIIRRES